MKITMSILVTAMVLAAGSLFAADMMSKEDRMKMADLHTKMAECLKSDKSLSDCRTEAMNSCKGMGMMNMMGKEGCAMGMSAMMNGNMQKGHMMHGKMMKNKMMESNMMNQDSKETTKKE